MKCYSCGAENDCSAKFCKYCGCSIANYKENAQRLYQPGYYQRPVVNNYYMQEKRHKPYKSIGKVPLTSGFYFSIIFLMLIIIGFFLPFAKIEYKSGKTEYISIPKMLFGDSDSSDGNIYHSEWEKEEADKVAEKLTVGMLITGLAMVLLLPFIVAACIMRINAGLALTIFILFIVSIILTFSGGSTAEEKLVWVEECRPGAGLWLMSVFSLIATICGYVDYSTRKGILMMSKRGY